VNGSKAAADVTRVTWCRLAAVILLRHTGDDR